MSSVWPIWRRFYFSNFSSKEERIEKAARSFDIAAYRGWNEVEASVKSYGVLPWPSQ